MSEPLLKIRNRHVPGCGDPPIVNDDEPHVYLGYFENPHGEQWVFTYDRIAQRGELRGGDIGWNEVFAVEDGAVPELILNRSEAMWMEACWSAATAGAPMARE